MCLTVSLCASVKARSEEHTSELQSHHDLVCRLLLEKKKQHRSARQATKHTKSTRTLWRSRGTVSAEGRLRIALARAHLASVDSLLDVAGSVPLQVT